MRFYWWVLIGIGIALFLLWLFFGNNAAVRAIPLHIATPMRLAHAIATEAGPGDDSVLSGMFSLETPRLAHPTDPVGRAWAQKADTPHSFHAPVPVDLTPKIPDAIAAKVGKRSATDELADTHEPKYFQRLTHKIAERVFGVPFESDVRPKWLRNPKTGYPLEYDCYCGTHSPPLAIEYHGSQHFVYPNRFHKLTPEGRAAFEAQRERDETKIRLSDELGVYLIVVPFNIHEVGPNAEKQIEAWLRYLAPTAVLQRQEAAAQGTKAVGGPETPWAIRAMHVEVIDPPAPDDPWRKVGDVAVTTRRLGG